MARFKHSWFCSVGSLDYPLLSPSLPLCWIRGASHSYGTFRPTPPCTHHLSTLWAGRCTQVCVHLPEQRPGKADWVSLGRECEGSRYPEHSLEGETWAVLPLGLPNTCPGREGWPKEDPSGPPKAGTHGRSPSMPVSKGISEEEEDSERSEFKSLSLGLLSSLGGRGCWEEPNRCKRGWWKDGKRPDL